MSLSPSSTEPVGQSRWVTVPICELLVFFLTWDNVTSNVSGIRWCSPGISVQVGAGEAGHRHTEAGGEAVLGHAGEGVWVLQLGVDDAQSVVRVALAGVNNPAWTRKGCLWMAFIELIRIHIVKSLTFPILCDENKELFIPLLNTLSQRHIFYQCHCCFLYV